MDAEYDVVVCGTGLKECIISGLLSVHGKKVLHVDRNGYYGGDSASLNLTNLYEKFRPGQTPPDSFGSNRDWNVDVIPKFVMACGKLVKILLQTKVTRYLQWQVADSTFVYQYQKGMLGGMMGGPKYIHKVPSTEMEVLKSPLMSLMEKNRCKNFFQLVANWKDEDVSTHHGFNRTKTTTEQVYQHYNLGSNTIDFIGHSLALYPTDQYMKRPFGEMLDKVKLYMYSIARYGQSPFLYPLYGLGGLPEGFSRLSAIHGGTYMLKTPIDSFVFDNDGKVCGVKSAEGEVAKCRMVVCDPSYVTNMENKTRKTAKVIRAICILGAPIPETNNAGSCQIIIPQKQLNRTNDVYILMVSSVHCVCPKGKFIAIVSTTVETNTPEAEIKAALDLLGPIEEKFVSVSEIYEPCDDGKKDQIFVSASYDATSHFESASEDVLRIWANINGEPLDLNISADPEDLQEE